MKFGWSHNGYRLSISGMERIPHGGLGISVSHSTVPAFQGLRSEYPCLRLGRTTSHITTRIPAARMNRSEEHTSELQSQSNLVCRLLLEKKKKDVRTNVVDILR